MRTNHNIATSLIPSVGKTDGSRYGEAPKEIAMADPQLIFVTWDEYFSLMRTLFRNIRESGFTPRQIVCIARGGIIPGELASRTFRAPLAVLSVASYPDKTMKQEEIVFSRDLTTTKPLIREAVLVLDDLTETGTTLLKTVGWLCYWYSIPRTEVRTATVWHKEWSDLRPDFFAKTICKDPITGARPWIHQPQEQFADACNSEPQEHR